MARRSLRPHLNQIRQWVRQGRTDAWIAHQLEVPVQQVESFKSENELLADGNSAAAVAEFEGEIDLRAEDDALIATQLKAEEAERAAADERRAADEAAAAAAAAEAGETDDEDLAPARRRGRRGGRGRRKLSGGPLEGTFDHGEEGYGLWLDPAVADDALYAEHWAGHRPVMVTVEADQIIIRRAGDDEPAEA